MVEDLTVRRIMETDVLMASPDASAFEAAMIMSQKSAGSLVVMNKNKPVGIFTERDLLQKCVVSGRDLREIKLREVMTKDIVSMHPDKTIEDAHQKMLRGDFRHILVVENSKLVGIFSIRDLVRVREQVLEQRVYEKTREIRNVQGQLADSLEMLRRELSAASRFQKYLINRKYPSARKKIHFSHVYEQASSVGGDFFEVSKIGSNHIAIFMADVMGHGVTSAMIAIELKMYFDQIHTSHVHPSPVITKMNRRLIPLMPPGYFVAGFYGIIDLKSMDMEYTQFGLPGPLVLKKGASRVIGMPHVNVPLGINDNTRYKSRMTHLHSGDMLLLFTDGCVEQKNPSKKMFGEKKFVAAFKEIARDGKGKIAKRLYNRVVEFADGEPIGDDIAILLCEIL